MTIQPLEHVGIVVDDLVDATAFFVALGLKLQGKGSVEGGSVDRGAELVAEVERDGDSYRLCYVRGPQGIIVELAEQIR